MSKRLISIFMTIAILLCVLPVTARAATPVVEATVAGIQNYDEARAVSELVNQSRGQAGAAALKFNATLTKAAMQRAAEIALYYSHTRPDGSDCFTVFSDSYDGRCLGENIAIVNGSSKDVMTAWMNSPMHKDNILYSDFDQIGVGCFTSGNLTCWVQLFSGGSSDTAVVTKTGSVGTNVTVRTLTDWIESATREDNKNMVLGEGESDSLEFCYPNYNIWGGYCNLIPRISNITDSNGRTIATLTAATDGSGIITVTAKAPGRGNINLPMYAGENAPTQLSLEVSSEGPFIDVGSRDYYFEPSLWAYSNNITSGDGSADIFNPTGKCTRKQVVTFLWRAAGSPEPAATECLFTDVKPTDYFYKAVLWAVENEITKGISDTEFGSNEICTRAQVATFLWRTADSPEPDGTAAPFEDVSTSSYYYDAVLWAAEQSITAGDGSAATFNSAGKCTRAQIVTFLYRFMG